MTVFEPSSRGRRGVRRRRRATLGRVAAGLLAAAVLFGVGVALGEALHDNPAPGRDVTYVRRLRPRTVVVTVTKESVSKSSALERFLPRHEPFS